MRRLIGLLALLVAVAGCKNQAGTGYVNPFVADRVPPPSTRVLAPGTAQPYYPGDPAPAFGAPVVGAPVIGAPATAAPGAPLYPAIPGAAAPVGAPTYPQTTPPGGWYGPQSNMAPSVTPTAGFRGDTVNVPGDQQQLRFAATQQSSSNPTAASPWINAPSVSTFNALANAPTPTRLPNQSILPSGSGQYGASASPSTTGRLIAREVTPAEYMAPGAFATGSANAARDGFRPQGSVPQTAAADDSFQRPEIRRDGTTGADDASRYAVGQNYESLRGQLEYWPESGRWSLRYLPPNGSADSVGGRVMIDNPQVLANLQPGELVSVRGQLFNKTTESGAVAPTYRVAGVQRQRQ